MNEAEALNYVIDLVYDRCRIRLNEGKQHLIKARLGKRMRLHGLETLPKYCDFLQRDAGETELTEVVNCLTTNFTTFLREPDHFKFLTGEALPSLLPKGQQRFNIWSAACSSGEEPYSIAFYLSEFYPLAARWDWRILATDISTKALDKGRHAVYSADRLETLPSEWIRRYFQRGRNGAEGLYRVKPQLQERVTFRQLNLLGQYNFAESFAVIFCRNVMIYFDRPTQQQLVQRLAQFLAPQGYLLVGHSESLLGLNIPLRCLRPSVYQKK
jgi:chemotaxis protein methyltransferase CheR